MPDPVRRRWSAAEISSLRKLAQKHPAAQIATQLGRSRSATAVKAHELHLALKVRRQTPDEPSLPGADPGPAGFDWPQ